jgi:hypothetical protein
MKKAILGITAGAFVCAAAFTPTPASAFVWVMFPAVMAAKKDPNFVSVNPYAKKDIRIARSKRHR